MLDLSYIPNILKKSLFHGGQFADLYFENSFETNITIENKQLDEIISGTDQGVGLRIIDNLNTLYGFTNSTDKNSIYDLASQLSRALTGQAFDKDINLKKQEPNQFFPILKNPKNIPIKSKIELCEKASKLAWSLDPNVSRVYINYNESIKQKQIANSIGEWVEFENTIISFYVSISLRNADQIYTSKNIISEHSGFEVFDDYNIEQFIKNIVHQAQQNKKAKSISGGRLPVVLASQAGGTMIHEAIGHGLEADLVQNNLSVYKNKLGKQIANKNITIIDDATIAKKRGSYSFDDEGSPSQRTVLIENGILKNYMCDRLTGYKMNCPSTGNGRRESYEYRPIVRMTNTILMPGHEDPKSIIRSVDNGILVTDVGGGQVNTANGDFVFDCNEAYTIKHGQIEDPIKKATLTGNSLEILNSIEKIGTDLGFTTGTCGKEDQSIPVSDAIPTILIPGILVGGKV